MDKKENKSSYYLIIFIYNFRIYSIFNIWKDKILLFMKEEIHTDRL